MTMVKRLTKLQVEQAARLAVDRERVERRIASLTSNQAWLTGRQVRDRFGGRSAMWLWRRTNLDDKFPKPKRFGGRLLFWSLQELKHTSASWPTCDRGRTRHMPSLTPRQLALDLIARGFAPVPVPVGAKAPNLPKWQLLRITAETVDQYFNGTRLNAGAIMGPSSNNLTDVDLDCKEAMALAPSFLPKTNSIYGRASKRRSHYLYYCGDADPKSVIRLKDDHSCIVELRLGGSGKGAQSVMPGSLHTSGEQYEWDVDGPIASASCAVLKVAITKIAVGTILIRNWPARGSQHDAALVLGGFLARAGWNADDVDHFVTTICTVHGEAELPDAHGRTARDSCERHAEGGQVYGYPQMEETFGASAAKQIAKLVRYRREDQAPSLTDADALEDRIDEMNEEYAYIIAGTNVAVMTVEDGNIRLIQPSAFVGWHKNRPAVQVGRKRQNIADYWISHPERREYRGIEFDPSRSGGRAGYYNTWRGFAVEPREGDCSKFLAHIKSNVATNNDAHSNWIVGWFAQIFQEPDKKPGTSLVLRGKQGVGKTIVGKIIGSLIGTHHYLLVSEPRYITGQFNAHTASLLLLHADEAFWAGDKRSEGKLKSMITEDDHLVEYKRIDPIKIANHMRLFVTGNHEWIIPAGLRERRFAVFDVGDGNIQDYAYFAAVEDEMNNGGREALLHHFLNFDLTKVKLRIIPRTKALLDQQVQSSSPEDAWWYDMLTRGVLPGGCDNSVTCSKMMLFRNYKRHATDQGARHKVTAATFGKLMKKYVGPNLKNTHPRVNIRRGLIYETRQIWCYEFPPLAECRKRFADELGQTIEWEDNQEWELDDDQIVNDDEISF